MEREMELEVEGAYIWRLNVYICRIRAVAALLGVLG
jgi:hypothetical protein